MFAKRKNKAHEKQLAELQAEIAVRNQLLFNKNRELATKDQQIAYLIKSIRETDNIIFSISQCTNWESMRPRVNQLTEEMMARKVIESKRINDIVTSELVDVYKPGMKQLTNK